MTVSSPSRAAVLSRPQESLVELLDRTIGMGIVVAGDLTLSVADVDLVYLNLRALLASVASLEVGGTAFPAHGGRGVEGGPDKRGDAPESTHDVAGEPRVRTPSTPPRLPAGPRPSSETAGRDGRLDRGLVQLVLTVVELLRGLMERQAIRRVDAGLLEPEQVDRLGAAFERLERQMKELIDHFALGEDDLTLRIGPLA